MHKGDRLIFATAGAGGQGDPLDREPERVAKDVRAGLVTVDAAREDYGVVLGADGEARRRRDDRGARAPARLTRAAGRTSTSGRCRDSTSCRARIAAERREFESAMAEDASS